MHESPQGFCIVCNGPLSYFFEKNFCGQWSLDKVEYWKCSCCGLTLARTIYEMSQQAWRALNDVYHTSLFVLSSDAHAGQDPRRPMRLRDIERFRAQVLVIGLLCQRGLLPRRFSWVDYGCGDGLLADSLTERQMPTQKFDPYIQGEGFLTVKELEQQFSVVISTAVFEHVRKREDLDRIASLVAEDGVLALHTFVCEAIPKDPDWFYLLPVHCTMFTNNSMQRLFDQWGFMASLYHVPSQMWFWFRKNIDAVKSFMESTPTGFHAREAFVDYWK